MQKITRFIGVPVLLALLQGQGQAVQTGDTTRVEFSGRLVALVSCQINSDQLIEVAFGNVGINKIDSGEFIRPLAYSLGNCGSASNTVQMMFKATPSGLDKATMSTSVAGLGVKVLKDGEPLVLNQYFKIADVQNPPQLQVQLVKDPTITLKESAFTATGTLLAEYQ